MNHVMVDVEALRLNQPWKAPLMQVAAVHFDETGTGSSSFNRFINQTTLPDWADPEQATVDFWKAEPSFEKLMACCRLGTDPETLLRELSSFIDGRIVWFAGPQYDQVMLEAYFDGYGLRRPWKYNDVRDFRTIRKQYPKVYDRVAANRVGLHNAIEDCWFQVEVLGEINDTVHSKIWR